MAIYVFAASASMALLSFSFSLLLLLLIDSDTARIELARNSLVSLAPIPLGCVDVFREIEATRRQY